MGAETWAGEMMLVERGKARQGAVQAQQRASVRVGR